METAGKVRLWLQRREVRTQGSHFGWEVEGKGGALTVTPPSRTGCSHYPNVQKLTDSSGGRKHGSAQSRSAPPRTKPENAASPKANAQSSGARIACVWAAADTSAPRKFPVGGDLIVRGDSVIDVTARTKIIFYFLSPQKRIRNSAEAIPQRGLRQTM